MSSLQTKIAKTIRSVDPLAYEASKSWDPGLKQLEDQEKMDIESATKDAAAAAAYDEKLGAVNREMSIASRDQRRGQAAAAAGATRSDNEADLLGYVPSGAKRKSASRTILG